MKNPKRGVGKGRADPRQCDLTSQGDANRSYTDEDQSSSNLEEFDKLPEGLDNSGGKHSHFPLRVRSPPELPTWS